MRRSRGAHANAARHEPASRPADETAALALIQLTRQRPGELTLVALAPLTNLALAVRLDPELPSRVRRLVVMGGAVTGHGNTGTVPAEFNVLQADGHRIWLSVFLKRHELHKNTMISKQ